MARPPAKDEMPDKGTKVWEALKSEWGSILTELCENAALGYSSPPTKALGVNEAG